MTSPEKEATIREAIELLRTLVTNGDVDLFSLNVITKVIALLKGE